MKNLGLKLKRYGLFLSACFNILVFFILPGISFTEPVIDEWVMGDKLPYRDRPIDDPGFVCPIILSSGERVTFFARVQTTSSMQIPLNLYNSEGFLEEKQIIMFLSGNLFAIRFMKLNNDSGINYTLFSMFSVAAFINMLFVTVIFYRMSVLQLMLLAVTKFIIGIPAVLLRWYRGFPPGRFFARSWAASGTPG